MGDVWGGAWEPRWGQRAAISFNILSSSWYFVSKLLGSRWCWGDGHHVEASGEPRPALRCGLKSVTVRSLQSPKTALNGDTTSHYFLPENRIQTNLWANYKPSIVLPTSSPNNTKQKLFQGRKRRLVHNFQLSPACSRHKRREQRDIKSCKTNKNLWRNTGPL